MLGIRASAEASLAEEKVLVSGLIELLIEVRQFARSRKDWTTADKIRDGLADLGVKLEDGHDGTIWKLER